MSTFLREPSGNNPEILSSAIKSMDLFSPNQTSALEITSSFLNKSFITNWRNAQFVSFSASLARAPLILVLLS